MRVVRPAPTCRCGTRARSGSASTDREADGIGGGETSGNELSCRELVEIVTDYLEGKLPSEDRARFDDHLSECRGCTIYVEQIRETIRLTGRLREADIPAAARDRLLDAFRSWKRA